MSIYSFTAEELEEIRKADQEIEKEFARYEAERQAQECGKLKAQRKIMGISQYELAELVGVSQTTIGSWERGVLPIPWNRLEKFGIREDFDMDSYRNRENPNIEIGKSLRRYRESKGMTMKQFSESVGIAYVTLSRWEKGKVKITWSVLENAGISKEDIDEYKA